MKILSLDCMTTVRAQQRDSRDALGVHWRPEMAELALARLEGGFSKKVGL